MFSTYEMSRVDTSATIHALWKSFTDTAVPEILYTDNGPPFPSYEVQDFLRRWGVRWVSPYYARSNSYAENGVKQAKGLLRKCIRNRRIGQEKWCKGLLFLRNTPHKQTLGFEKYRRVINSSPQSMQESDFEHETNLEHEPRMSWSKVASECSNSTTAPSREDIMYQGPGGCIVAKCNVTIFSDCLECPGSYSVSGC